MELLRNIKFIIGKKRRTKGWRGHEISLQFLRILRSPFTQVVYKRKDMAKKATNNKTNGFEQNLWDTANKLRGSVESSEYKHVVLSLIFLKFASDKFEERRAELIAEGKEKYLDMVEFYTMKNVFYLPEVSRWSYVKKHAKQDDLAIKIDTALATVEKNNKALKGALPDNYFSRLGLDGSKLAALIDTISNIDTVADKKEDVVGRVYEYFLGKFAAAEGKGGGEFYTPKDVVNLIAEMIKPYKARSMTPAAVPAACLFSPSSLWRTTTAIPETFPSTGRSPSAPPTSWPR